MQHTASQHANQVRGFGVSPDHCNMAQAPSPKKVVSLQSELCFKLLSRSCVVWQNGGGGGGGGLAKWGWYGRGLGWP